MPQVPREMKGTVPVDIANVVKKKNAVLYTHQGTIQNPGFNSVEFEGIRSQVERGQRRQRIVALTSEERKATKE